MKRKENAYSKLQLNYWGELKAAIEIFEKISNSSLKVKNIKRQPNSTPDLIVKLNNNKTIGVEVKSSSFKNDYFSDFWMFGVPLKKKDLETKEIDIIAMVNAVYFWKGKKVKSIIKKGYDFVDLKLQLNTKSIILFFNISELNEIPLSPLLKIPIPLLLMLKNEDKEYLGKFLKINNNNLEINYKGFNINGNLIFRILNRNNTNLNKLGEFPNYFGSKEKCYLIREFHKSMKKLSKKIENNTKKYQDLEAIIFRLQKERSRVFEQEFMPCPDDCPEIINCKTYLKKSKLFFNL